MVPMVLAPHAIVGAATAVVFRKHPIIAVCAAFLSHFVLDAIPHWHYRLASWHKDPSRPHGIRVVFGKTIVRDLSIAAIDFSIGTGAALAASLMFVPHYFLLVLAGAIAGILPDALQIVYYLFPDSAIRYLQRFHMAVHSKKNLDEQSSLGVAFQLSFSAAVIASLILARRF